MEGNPETTMEECPRRGRPRSRRILDGSTESRCYEPRCCPSGEGIPISLRPEEIELIRLIDIEGLEQEEAAARLGVSRKTVWRDIHETHRKIADALVNGKGIEMAGCPRAVAGECPCTFKKGCGKRDEDIRQAG
jgi:uncharacterized protein